MIYFHFLAIFFSILFINIFSSGFTIVDLAAFRKNTEISDLIKSRFPNALPTLCTELLDLYHRTQKDPGGSLSDMVFQIDDGRIFAHSFIVYAKCRNWIYHLLKVLQIFLIFFVFYFVFPISFEIYVGK